MAKKSAKGGSTRRLRKADVIAKLESLRPIAEDDDTCEMPNMTINLVRKAGRKENLWLVGVVGHARKTKSARKRR